MRYNTIAYRLNDEFRNQAFQNPTSVQSEALKWVAESDQRDLDLKENELMERYVLTVLYLSTKGHKWPYNTYWFTTAHACDWKNVECIYSGGERCVTSLHLFQNKLHGNLPTELIHLLKISFAIPPKILFFLEFSTSSFSLYS